MTVPLREQLLQAARTWVKTALQLPDEKVILEQRDGLKSPRLALPYYMVGLPSFDRARGVDEWEEKTDDTRLDWGNREATLRINGFGEHAEEGLQLLGLLTHDFPAGADVRSLGPLIDVSSIQSESWESRFIKDFAMSYRIIYERDNRAADAPGAKGFVVAVNDALLITHPEP